ncbi:cobaltochelatase subunit CobN [Microlunatus soli]|uniref:Cobaltochelatase CobN n=1 Tax=Microlunatus soli TaxID=630515 RepID=A0A1H1ZG17_9ACTN|nr:cobaltochelatase subunit CobN [Microlunatus soli]SDT32725.1 cobaltochelatase CobN [Microlunatus soli]
MRIALLSTSDTDLLSARASGADYLLANPSRTPIEDYPRLLEGADIVIARLLGSPQAYRAEIDRLRSAGRPLVVLGGEQSPDAALMEQSSVPIGIATDAHQYLAEGGPGNLSQLHAFLSDTVLLSGDGFDPPVRHPAWGPLRTPPHDTPPEGDDRPKIAILFYRAQFVAGNTAYVEALADAIDAAGGLGVPIFTTSLRDAPPELITHLGDYQALITTVLAAGGNRPATASAGEQDEGWDVAALAGLDVPILQGLCLTTDRATWATSDDGLTPLDVATQIAVPEFDGRIITVPFSFKETDAEGLPHYVADRERCRRVAEIAVGHARLSSTPPAERKIAIVLSAYPTKHSRIGNAVGLDTPVSTIRLLRLMREAGYDLGDSHSIPGLDPLPAVEDEEPDTTAGNALIHALIDAGGQDPEWLTAEQLSGQPIRIPAATYRHWLDELPVELVERVTDTWGAAPGELFVDRSSSEDDGELVAAAIRSGNIVILVQPPRGFGENPIAIYHDPDLPPSHHYLATYRWLEKEFGAHAIVHVGKHGNLEWLPGKTAGMSAACGTDAALGSVPLIYPFLVNDPGEGTQAKRRAHATVIDHLVPPMARAESYGDIARLEQLLDEYAGATAMDPAKAPALRGQIWELITTAQLHRDLGLEERPDDAEFDEFVLHVDGWLCEIKDVQIRDGLHVLGQPPTGAEKINLVLAILRSPQLFGGRTAAAGLRSALGLADDAPTHEVDVVEEQARSLVAALDAAGWSADRVPDIVHDQLGSPSAAVEQALIFACTEIVPRLERTTDELAMVLHALDGGYIPAGPSGSPLRGLVNVLPTGRNFYSVDPKAVPSALAYRTGRSMADSLLDRYRQETGEYPPSVGLSMWGTSAMRTSGDDIGEVLALLGVRPVWDEASRRVTGLEAVPLEELGRPRIDVTVRISGFFRDAFPHVVSLIDDAVGLVIDLDEPDDQNFPRRHALADQQRHGDRRRASTRIFGSKPGSYGAGLLPLMESGNWRTDEDLAEVYTTWGGYAYGRDLDGVPAGEDMRDNYRRISVAAKNIDSREHDIADSDDYFQYHGGMIATVRALTGEAPKAYVGDSTSPDAVRTRSLAEETSRVFRSRVVNPRWIAAMRRHGYKGAFELAATVDYLFGFDATTGVVGDWMYAQLAENYLLDKETQDFLAHANPWAMQGMIEKLTEAADRGLWAEPDPQLMDQLRRLYLDTEGELEDR